MTLATQIPVELRTAGLRWDTARAVTARRRAYYRGRQPNAFIAAGTRRQLDARLSRLGVNYPRLAATAVGERLDLTGAKRAGEVDAELWKAFRRAGGLTVAPLVHTDYLALGAAYVTVWADQTTGAPAITADTAETMHVERDAVTGRPAWAVRRWDLPDGAGQRAVIVRPDSIETWETRTASAVAGTQWSPDGPALDNPLGVVPVVPFVRRVSSDDPEFGVPICEDIYDLTDALNKVVSDALVTSEYFARPRRWVTGLEIELDDEGRPIDPFGDSRLLQSESAETRFGQLDPPNMAGYADVIATLTQQIGALTGLPPHYLGLSGDQPASSDAVNAAENQLVQRADTEQAALTGPWAMVFDLLAAITAGTAYAPADTEPMWGDTQSRTPAQEVDAATKLAGVGVPLADVLARLRYSPEDAARIAEDARRTQLLASLHQ